MQTQQIIILSLLDITQRLLEVIPLLLVLVVLSQETVLSLLVKMQQQQLLVR